MLNNIQHIGISEISKIKLQKPPFRLQPLCFVDMSQSTLSTSSALIPDSFLTISSSCMWFSEYLQNIRHSVGSKKLPRLANVIIGHLTSWTKEAAATISVCSSHWQKGHALSTQVKCPISRLEHFYGIAQVCCLQGTYSQDSTQTSLLRFRDPLYLYFSIYFALPLSSASL